MVRPFRRRCALRASAAGMLALVTLAALAGPARPRVLELHRDDGTGESGLGVDADVTLLWLNQFDVPPSSWSIRPPRPPRVRTTVLSVGAAWRAMPPGRAATIVVFSDPDQDRRPHDARVVAQWRVRTPDVAADVLTWFAPPHPVALGPPGTSFFVGVLFVQPEELDLPAPLDRNGPRRRASWLVAGDEGEGLDLDDLAANALGPLLIDDACGTCAGNWRLRARVGSSG